MRQFSNVTIKILMTMLLLVLIGSEALVIRFNFSQQERSTARGIASCMLEGDINYSSISPPQSNDSYNLAGASQIESAEFNLSKLKEWLPKQISSDEKGSDVINKIADRGVKSFLTSESFKSSSLGRLNEKVKDETKIEVNIKQDGKTDHKISANLEPFQQSAILTYSGVMAVELSYYLQKKVHTVKFIDTLLNKKVFYENRVSVTDHQNNFGVQWDW